MADTKKTAPKAAAAKAPKAAPAQAEGATVASKQHRREVTGTVVSDKMTKTIVVKVDRRVRHGLYKKYIVRSRRFKAHDEKNEAKIGDQVVLVESRPLSRDKRWALQRIVRRAGQVIEVAV